MKMRTLVIITITVLALAYTLGVRGLLDDGQQKNSNLDTNCLELHQAHYCETKGQDVDTYQIRTEDDTPVTYFDAETGTTRTAPLWAVEGDDYVISTDTGCELIVDNAGDKWAICE